MPDPGAPPAGWLLDPDDPTLLRWWDGTDWSGFRRPRDLPATPAPVLVRPVPAPPTPSMPLPPSPAAATAPSAPPPPAPADDVPTWAPPARTTDEPAASAPPFWEQWDDVVLRVTAGSTEEVRRRRQDVAATVRDRVVAGAAPGERVLRVLAVAVHDLARSGREVGARLFVADLVVTDHRLLLWADETDPDLALIEVATDDVAGLRALPGPAVALDLAGGGRPLVLAARDAALRGDLLDLLHRTVPADRPRA